MNFRHRSIRRIKNHTHTTSQSKVTDSNVKMEWKKNSKRGSTVSALGMLPGTQYELKWADEVKIMVQFIMPK